MTDAKVDIEIENGWFWSAGTMYGWTSDGFMKEGVGINKNALFGTAELIVEIDDVRYTLNCQEAIDFVRKYHSRKVMKGGTVIGVISRSLLSPIY